MATKKEKELGRKVKKIEEEVRRQDKIIEKLRIQLGLYGVRTYRAVARNKPQF